MLYRRVEKKNAKHREMLNMLNMLNLSRDFARAASMSESGDPCKSICRVASLCLQSLEENSTYSTYSTFFGVLMAHFFTTLSAIRHVVKSSKDCRC